MLFLSIIRRFGMFRERQTSFRAFEPLARSCPHLPRPLPDWLRHVGLLLAVDGLPRRQYDEKGLSDLYRLVFRR